MKEDATVLKKYQSLLSQTLETSVRMGPSAHKIPSDISFIQRKRLAENAEDSLYTILFCYAIASKNEIDFSDHTTSSLSRHMARFRRRSKDNPFIPMNYRELLSSDTSIRWNHTNLVGVDLSNINFSHQFFYRTDFNGANLSNSNFTHCTFHYVDLRNSDLSCTDLTRAQFHVIKLEGANFSDALIDGAFLPKNWRSKVKYDKDREPKGKPILVGKNHIALFITDNSGIIVEIYY